MKKRIISMLLACMMIFSLMPTAVFATGGDNVAKIGTTEYDTLANAVTAAKTGDVIEITKAGIYTLPGIP